MNNNAKASATLLALLAGLAMSGGAKAFPVMANDPAPGDNFTNAGASNQGQALVNANGWYYNNVRNNGAVGINTTHSDPAGTGNGSVSFTGAQGPGGNSSKADIEYLAEGIDDAAHPGNFIASGSLGKFTSLMGMSFDWWRDSSSTNDPAQHPSLRVLLDLDGDLSTLGDRGALIFEGVYNGKSVAATDAWQHDAVSATTVLWNSGLFSTGTIDLDSNGYAYDSTLADWKADSRMANAVIVGFSSGIGSGWGPFSGAVDNISWKIGDGMTVSNNFEVEGAVAAVPEPASIALVAISLVALGASRRRKR